MIRAMITGAAGGLGQAIVRKFLDYGSTVIAVDMSEVLLEELKRQLDAPDRLITVCANVTDRSGRAHV